jgi:hypothetical protein
MRKCVIGAFAWLLSLAWLSAGAADLVIYDDASENGFNPGCSFFATPDFAETTVVHSGSDAISFAPAMFGAVSWCAPSSLSTTDYSALTFWVNGGASGSQNLQLVVGLAGNPVVSASLDTLLGQSIPAGTWVQVNASFDAMPSQYSGNFDQISIQDNSGNDPGTPQPTVYFDDVILSARAAGSSDEIFKNGFEAVTGTVPIRIEQNVSACNGLDTERYTWQDSGGWTRSATFSHNDTGNAGHRGEMCDYTFQTDATDVREIKSLDASGAGGFGYIVSHLYNTAPADQIGVDDSPLGHGFSGTYTRLLQGRHHAILRFNLDYPRYYCTLPNPQGSCTSATTTYQMPVTIDWLIATGRDHPLWTVSFDLSGAPANAINADTRAPYGDMAFDGDASGGFGDTVMGVAWGDHYQFTSTGPDPVSFNSTWNWDQANTIPYVYLWTQTIDAEMGIVQSEDISKQDAGGYYGQGSWGETSADGNACATTFGDGNYLMPCDSNWPYQSINYALDPNNPDSNTNDKRLAWGAEFGFLGQSTYSGNDGSNQTGWPRESYSTYVVLGLHSPTPTAVQVKQVENAMSSTFSASVGTVLTSGPAGAGRSDPRSYAPTGYDRVYATWNVQAAANAATVTLNPGGLGLSNPIFVLHGYTAASAPGSVVFNGRALTADVDYFATVDSAGSRLWITINTDWNASSTLQITP